MLTNEQILQTLKNIHDPELHQSIVDLNMVRNIQVDGTHVSLDVILTIKVAR
ncbi:iron-sulfur cluster assembly protein [Paenibacillus sp. Sa2BVA9]|uniref:Iron-sulfur cluster assembly protein n=1 Tax=Paenibacillus gallinarum TaxID=2762232 RepID=A0ABR8SSU2_9BACL|nr:iron-sulfur cluster assembly protein [Paenibacillus gallinarum]